MAIPEAFKRRKQMSAVSLACDMAFYVVDTLFTVVLAVTASAKSQTPYIFLFLAWQLAFPIRYFNLQLNAATITRCHPNS